MFELFFTKSSEGVEEKENLEDKRMFDELADYVVSRNITSAEIQEAYFRLCGVVDSEEPTAVVRQLQEKMRLMTEQRFPLNRFTKLIETTDLVENGDKDFYRFVDGLNITIEEKDVLKSIVFRMRSGELVILTEGNHEPITELVINATDIPQHFFGFMLSRKIKEVLTRLPHEAKIEFSFKEK